MPSTLSIDSDLFDMPPRSNHSPAARAADISRILDPSYSPSSSKYPNSLAYLDRHGHLHDPDFRHFPIAPTPSKRQSTYMATRPRWELFDEDALDDDDEENDLDHQPTKRHSFSSYHYSRPYSPQRPSPPLPHSFDSEDTVLNECDDDDNNSFIDNASYKQRRGVTRIIQRTKQEISRRRRSLESSSIHSAPAPYPYSHSHSHSPIFPSLATTATTAVSDADADATSLYAHSHHCPLTHTFSRHSRVSHRSQHSRLDEVRVEAEADSRHGHDEQTQTQPHHPRSHFSTHSLVHDATRATSGTKTPSGETWTPTCSQALKRQWQAVALRVRLGVFRAHKRMKSRLQPALVDRY